MALKAQPHQTGSELRSGPHLQQTNPQPEPRGVHPLEVHPLEVHPLEPRWVHPLEVRSHLQQTKQQAPASADRTSTRMIWSGKLCSATCAVQIVGNTSITKHLVAETGPLGTCASGI